MSIADDVLDGLGPGFNRVAGPLLEPLVVALLADGEEAAEMLAPTVEGWPALFDLTVTRSPGWLAQLAGVRVDSTLSIDRQRALIVDRPEWATGTYQGLLATLKTALVGRQRVIIDERDGSPWHVTISVHESDFGPSTTAETIAALAERHRPAGMTFTYVYLAATSYGSAEIDAETYEAAEAAAGTYAAAES